MSAVLTESAVERVLRVAVADGEITRWCRVVSYSPGRRVVLSRTNTDGLHLIVTIGRVGQALRRVETRTPEQLGLSEVEVAAILGVAAGSEPTGETADLIVQIAAVGRVMYR